MTRIIFDSTFLLKTGIAELAILVLWIAIWIFFDTKFMPFNIWIGVATVMLFMACFRIYQFIQAKQKVDSLNQKNFFSVSTDFLKNILKKNPDKIYLGKGYVWENKHIQNYHQILALPERKKYIDLESKAGGYEFVHNLGLDDEKDIIVPRDEMQHTIIAGTTRVGKTRLIELLVYQLIAAGEPVIVIDPKGDADLLNSIYAACVDCGKEKDFKYFSLAHTGNSSTFNPLSNYGSASDIADRVASIMPSGGDSEPFVKFSWQVLETIASVLIAINEPINLETLQKYSLGGMQELVDLAKEKLSSLSYEVRGYAEKCIERLEEQASHPKDHFQKMITSLGPVLTALNSGDAGRLLNPEESDIHWQDVLEEKKVCYFYLASMLKGQVAENVGKMVVQDFLYFIGELYAFSNPSGRINLIIDEFYNVMFPGYVDILNKAGGAGVRVFLAMQTTSDIITQSSGSMAKQILGNINNKIYLRVPEKELAEEFCGLFGKVKIHKISRTRNVGADAKSQNELFRSGYAERLEEEEVDLINPEMIMHLPKGQAFAFNQARDPYKLRFPLIDRTTLPKVDFAESLRELDKDISPINLGPGWANMDGAEIEWVEEIKK